MYTVKISQNNISIFGPSIKTAINNGIWTLYIIKINKKNKINNLNYVYMLVTDNRQYYYIDGKGNIIEKFDKRPLNIRYKCQIYFSDLPFPDYIKLPFVEN